LLNIEDSLRKESIKDEIVDDMSEKNEEVVDSFSLNIEDLKKYYLLPLGT